MPEFVFSGWDNLLYDEVKMINKGHTIQIEPRRNGGMPTVQSGTDTVLTKKCALYPFLLFSKS